MPDEVRICSWGLGYDSSSDDYKVVIITSSKELAWDDTNKLIVCVYSLKSGLWERIADFPYFSTHLEYPCVCVGDGLHWKVLGPDRSYLIVALHLGKLEYHLVPQPLITSNNFNLGVLDGCLYAIYENWTDDGFDLLVMKEYGVEEYWTLLISCTGWRNSFLVKPLAYTEDGDELIFITEFNIIVRYEFVTRSFRTMARRCLPRNLHDPLVYIPNLVCPQSGVRDGWHCDPRYS
ncbi:hypothetical protein DH2020_014560 [Rehmannia glutinosa]|uniref:F-box protein n=1 Tax=Rehmannia glutinosa TaxID=99300 RepID=A0ABR0WXH8_REHGL